MRRHLGSLIAILAMLAAAPAARASTLEIDAPGGLWYERDGTIRAAGLAGKPLVAFLDDYEVSAMSLHYDQRKRTGQALGGVRWRDRRSGAAREFRAETIAFALAAKTLEAEGGVHAGDAQVDLEADRARIDLAGGRYEIWGRQARASFGQHLFQADRIIYEAGQARRLTAEGGVCWRSTAGGETRTVQAAGLTYDLAARSAGATGGVKVAVREFQAASERLQYEEAADLLTLDGQPVLTRDSLGLTAAILAWQPAKGRIVATGGARLSERTFTGTGDELCYETAENRVRLLGAARLTRGRDTLTGDEIVYDLGTGLVSVTGGAKAAISLEGWETS